MQLKGWVYDEAGNPVAGATVDVYSYSNALLASTTSGADGSWSFSGLPEGPVRVKISGGGIVRWLEGGSEIVLARARIENLELPANSLPGYVLQDGSVPAAKLQGTALVYEVLATPAVSSSSSTVASQTAGPRNLAAGTWLALATLQVTQSGSGNGYGRVSLLAGDSTLVSHQANVSSSNPSAVLSLVHRLALGVPTNLSVKVEVTYAALAASEVLFLKLV